MTQTNQEIEIKPVRGGSARWKCRSPTVFNDRLPMVTRILRARGIIDPVQSAAFLDPKMKDLHDPGLLPGIDAASERLLRALRDGEQIAIYGDYDVDGITATAILYHVLHAVANELRPGGTANVRTYVPHRIDEGYGLNVEAMEELAAGGAKVVVSVDCGVTAFAPALRAKELGLDLIISDHHSLPEASMGLPDACAVVHPNLPGSKYPFGDLCGAGVAFKIAWRVATAAKGESKVSEPMRRLLVRMLALASLGVIADVVPLVGENRVMAKFGLAMMRQTKVAGLDALIRGSGLEGENVKEFDVGFKLAPRLNACGRMGHAREAVELFTQATGERATVIAEELNRLNDLRKRTQDKIFEEAQAMAAAQGMTTDQRRAIVLASREWHAGVVGIVCSKLVELFHRPTILLAGQSGYWHGSGRSVDGFDLHQAIHDCREHLTSFGGHQMAAGLRMEESCLPQFVDAFCERANQSIRAEDLCALRLYDIDARIDEFTIESVSQLDSMAPFGRGNPPVVLRVPRAKIVARPITMGRESKHLRLRLADSTGRLTIGVVAWGWGEMATRLPVGHEVDTLLSPRLSTWNGQTQVEAELVDCMSAGIM